LNPGDIIPTLSFPLAQAVVTGTVERGVAVCGSGRRASVCANKIPGVRAGLVSDHFSARQGVEDDHMNIICMGGRTIGPYAAWDILERSWPPGSVKPRVTCAAWQKVASLEPEVISERGVGTQHKS